MIFCGLDFEGRSGANLLLVGGHNYATHHTTQAICCGYSRDNKYYMWWPEWVEDIIKQKTQDPPPWVHRRKGELYRAWNSAFDRKIWNYVCKNDYGWPDTGIEDWFCTMTQARVNGLPASLGNAGEFLGVDTKKDKKGEAYIKRLSIPQNRTPGFLYIDDPVFDETPEEYRGMINYCDGDVRTEDSIVPGMRDMLTHELEEFWASEHINDNGIPIDVSFAKEAMSYASAETAVITEELIKLTDGAVPKHTMHAKLKAWITQGWEQDAKGEWIQVGPFTVVSRDALKEMHHGGKLSLDKIVRHNLLDLSENDEYLLTPVAKQVIEVVDMANKSSIAKYRKMARLETDGVVYGSYAFSGASSTGRFSAKGVQTQNMNNKPVDDWPSARKQLAEGVSDRQTSTILSKMLRGTIQPEYEDSHFDGADLANIEARVLPWVCNTPGSNSVLDLIRKADAGEGDDIYVATAKKMGLYAITLPGGLKPRTLGKVAVLSLGFGGGIGALLNMAAMYGVKISDDFAKRLVKLWREANPWAEPFWHAVKNAAWSALENPGRKFPVGRVSYFYTPNTHNGLGTLWCEFPCGRLISYINPRIEVVTTPWDPKETMLELTAMKASLKKKAGAKEWPRYRAWFGLLVENLVQGIAASRLRYSLTEGVRESSEHRFIRLHTHDEILVEADHDARAWVVDLLVRPAGWDEGLPLAAEANEEPLLHYAK